MAHQDHRLAVLERQVRTERAQVAQEQTQIYDIGKAVTGLPNELDDQNFLLSDRIKELSQRIDCLESNGIFVRQGC